MPKKSWIERIKKEPRYKVRKYTRCSCCGRNRGYIRKLKICRICFRELAHSGVLPGIRKSSW